ncbi:MAG TPA: metalloregulator ArsR/SmtB family transcription factor [Acidimicrobiia bacterium]|nr:metalloregulator ArsR/SmtB family transcription factor [Acidimicrobiia bacterium]
MDTTAVFDSTDLEVTASRMAALGDPTRLRILRTLAAGELCVCRLRDAVPVPANLLSYHLRVLRDAGLIRGTRRGRWVDYSVVTEVVDGLGWTLLGREPA